MVSDESGSRHGGTIWMLDLDEPARFIPTFVPAVFGRVEPQSATELAEAIGGQVLAEVLNRFRSGRRCYVARVDDRLAAYGWVSFDDELIGELHLRLKLLPGEAYIWDCATIPALRRNHLYSALLVYILGELRAEGFSRAWIGADLENMPSQQGIARAGFHHVADLVVARVLAMRQIWVQGLPDIPDLLVAEARRAFLNDRDKVWLNVSTST